MSRSTDRELIALAERQHQVVTVRQVVGLGIPRSTFYRMVRRGWWTQTYRGVFVRTGTEVTPFQRAIAATLACGPRAFASHCTAARVWGLDGIPSADPPQVTVTAERRPSRMGIAVYRTLRARPTDFTTFKRIPITTPMRTLLDLSPIVSERDLAVCLDDAHRRRLLSIDALNAYLAHPGNRSRPDADTLRALVALRDPGRPLDSALESDLFHLLRTVGLPLPIPQYWVETRKCWRRIDFAYPDRKIAIEADGYQSRFGLDRFDDDRARQNDLEELGWDFRRFTPSHVHDHPMEVVTTFAIALRVRPSRWVPDR